MNRGKILGIVLLASAAIMLVLSFINPAVVDEFNVYWIAAVLAAIPGLLLVMNQTKAASLFSRVVTGSVFVVSGLIKANDTVGFGIKLEEYFDENALGAFWANFHDFALPLAIFISGIEVLLGLAVIFGAKARLVSIALLAMTIFFGWLTYFTAQCNEAQMAAIAAGESFEGVCVTDCGCFGDALRGSVGRSLTPWESFYKDLGLFFLVLVIVFRSGSIKINKMKDDFIILPGSLLVMLVFGGWLFGWMFPTWFFIVSALVYYLLKGLKLKTGTYEWVLALALGVLTYGFAFYTYINLPIKDFRPYAVGANILDQMKPAEELGLEPTEYANIYKLENTETGESKTMNSKEYLELEVWKDKSWKIASTLPEPVVVKRGYEPPITSFSVTTEEGYDIGDEILNSDQYQFMVVMYDLGRTRGGDAAEELKELAEAAQAENHHFFAVTSSPYDEYETYRHENQWAFPFYTADEIFLKTIIRSNPGLVLLKNGTVLEKWSAANIPDYSEVKSKYIK